MVHFSLWWRQYRYLFFGLPALVFQVLFFCIPIAFILYTARDWTTVINWLYISIFARSIVLALVNGIICLCIAYPLVYFLAFKAGRFRVPGLFLLLIPFWTNFLLHVYAWFFVLERNGFLNTLLQKLHLIDEPIIFLNSFFAVMIMMVYYYMPFMILPLYAQMEKFDIRFFEASYDLGASWWQTIRYVLIPLTMPGIITGLLLVIVPSFGEFAIPELMGGDRYVFFGTVVSHLMLTAGSFSQGATCTLVGLIALGMTLLCIYACSRIWRKVPSI